MKNLLLGAAVVAGVVALSIETAEAQPTDQCWIIKNLIPCDDRSVEPAERNNDDGRVTPDRDRDTGTKDDRPQAGDSAGDTGGGTAGTDAEPTGGEVDKPRETKDESPSDEGEGEGPVEEAEDEREGKRERRDNGWGNGDQEAPGKSGDRNRAENNNREGRDG